MNNWKTTVTGALLAIIVAIQPILETGVINWKQIGLAAVIGLFGFLTKDFNK